MYIIVFYQMYSLIWISWEHAHHAKDKRRLNFKKRKIDRFYIMWIYWIFVVTHSFNEKMEKGLQIEYWWKLTLFLKQQILHFGIWFEFRYSNTFIIWCYRLHVLRQLYKLNWAMVFHTQYWLVTNLINKGLIMIIFSFSEKSNIRYKRWYKTRNWKF